MSLSIDLQKKCEEDGGTCIASSENMTVTLSISPPDTWATKKLDTIRAEGLGGFVRSTFDLLAVQKSIRSQCHGGERCISAAAMQITDSEPRAGALMRANFYQS